MDIQPTHHLLKKNWIKSENESNECFYVFMKTITVCDLCYDDMWGWRPTAIQDNKNDGIPCCEIKTHYNRRQNRNITSL